VVDSVATPAKFRETVPRSLDPFIKLTVPVGVAELLPFTVAVRVRTAPAVTGFGLATRVVVVDRDPPVTVTDTAAEVLAR
jgi:hypothetical protein